MRKAPKRRVAMGIRCGASAGSGGVRWRRHALCSVFLALVECAQLAAPRVVVLGGKKRFDAVRHSAHKLGGNVLQEGA